MKSLQEILKAKYAGDIFDKNNIKQQYREYLKFFHPDLHNGENQYIVATQKINELYKKAIYLIENNKWEKSNNIFINMPNGKKIVARYSYKKDFELGSFYVCRKNVIYIIKKEFKKFFDNMNIEKNFENINPTLKQNFDIFIPKVKYKFFDGENYIIIFEKTEDLIPLNVLYEEYNKFIPDKHVAWIISRLSNLCCLFKMARLVHCGIDIENIFVSPENHTLVLFGGWWYTVKINERLIGTTSNIFSCIPIYSKSKKVAREDIDLQSVKMVGKFLTKNNTNLPKPFKKWLESGSSTNGVLEFGKWDQALKDSYGERKFVKCNFDYKNFYK